MKKYMRFLSVFLCVVLLFTFSVPRETHAFPIAIPIIVVGLLLLAGGLVFASTEASNAAIDQISEDNPTLLDDIGNTLATASSFKLAADNITVNDVIDVAPEIWSTVKTWIDTNYNTGVNYINVEQTGGTLPDEYTYFQVGVPYYWLDNGQQWKAEVSLPGQYSITLYSYNGSSWVYQTQKYSEEMPYIKLQDGTYSIFRKYSGSWTIMKQIYFPTFTYNIQQPTGVTGLSNIVDNPAYDWINPQTGNKSVSIPLVQDPAGSIPVGGSIYSPAITEDDIPDMTIDDVTDADTSGLPVPETITPTDITDGINGWWASVVQFFINFFNDCRDFFGDLVGSIGDILAWLNGFFENLGQNISATLTSWWNGICQVFTDIKNGVLSIPDAIADAIKDIFPNNNEDIKNKMTPLGFTTIWRYVQYILAYISGFVALMVTIWGILPQPITWSFYAFIVVVLVLGFYRRLVT